MATALPESSPSTPSTIAPDIRRIALALLHESPMNTRQHFDELKLNELASSLRTTGQLTPLLARPSKLNGMTGFELAAGHRRRRAAERAGLETMLVIVRELDDKTFLEILTIENLQREDVHPLEEAQGYRNLLTIDGYDPKQIAARVGKSESYVYDRLRLLQLVPEAQELFLAHRIGLGHAIIMARIPTNDQRKLLENVGGAGGLWKRDHGHATLELLSPDKEQGSFGGLIPNSVRQLQAWVDDHVRFNPTDVSVAQLFPETAANVAAVVNDGAKLVSITYSYHVNPDAKDAGGARTYGPTSWKRADGKRADVVDGSLDGEYGTVEGAASKPCDFSVMGVIAAGEGRGDSFLVCIDKKRCTVHWGDEIRARNKRERDRESGVDSRRARPSATDEKAEAKRAQQEAARKVRGEQYAKAVPTLLTMCGRALKEASTSSTGALSTFVWQQMGKSRWGLDSYAKTAAKYVPRGTNASDFLRHVAMTILVCEAADTRFDQWNDPEKDFIACVALLKLDVPVKKTIDLVVLKPATKEKPPAPKSAPKKAAKPAAKAPKKSAAKKAPKPAAKKVRPRATSQFMGPKQPDAALAAIVGSAPLPRTEITLRVWAYIKKHGLQDAKERRMINADEQLKPVFDGKPRVSMFEMTRLVNKHIA